MRGWTDLGADLTGLNPLTPNGIDGAWQAAPTGVGSSVALGATAYFETTGPTMPSLSSPLSVFCSLYYHDDFARHIAWALPKDNTGSANNSFDLEETGSSGVLGIAIWGGTYTIRTSGVTQGWHDILATSDGLNWLLYVDGVVNSSLPSPTTQAGAIGVFRVGSFNAAFPSPYFNGAITDVRMWNYTVDADMAARLSDPATKWDLYGQPSSRVFFFPGASTGFLLVKN